MLLHRREGFRSSSREPGLAEGGEADNAGPRQRAIALLLSVAWTISSTDDSVLFPFTRSSSSPAARPSPSDAWADGGGAESPIRGGALAVASEITDGNEDDDDGGCGREGGGRDRRDG